MEKNKEKDLITQADVGKNAIGLKFFIGKKIALFCESNKYIGILEAIWHSGTPQEILVLNEAAFFYNNVSGYETSDPFKKSLYVMTSKLESLAEF